MKNLVIGSALMLALAGAPAQAKDKHVPSGLELQQMQAKDIEGTKDVVFGAVMSVLQDGGYRIQAADKDTGIITGISSTKSKMIYSLWTGFGKSKKSPIVSVFIETRTPSVTRVRLTFVMAKVKSSIYGAGAQDEEPIYDPVVYQDAFEKINQAVFIRNGMNVNSPPAPVAQSMPTTMTVSGTPSPATAP